MTNWSYQKRVLYPQIKPKTRFIIAVFEFPKGFEIIKDKRKIRESTEYRIYNALALSSFSTKEVTINEGEYFEISFSIPSFNMAWRNCEDTKSIEIKDNGKEDFIIDFERISKKSCKIHSIKDYSPEDELESEEE